MNETANNNTCVFALTQISGDFGCEFGEVVTRRTGPDIACQSEPMHHNCECVYAQLKQTGLSAFDYEDDLSQVPHGIWAKIQYGGLLGLQAELGRDADRVSNIASVIQAVIQQYEPLEEFPFVNLVPAMKVFRIRRKRMR